VNRELADVQGRFGQLGRGPEVGIAVRVDGDGGGQLGPVVQQPEVAPGDRAGDLPSGPPQVRQVFHWSEPTERSHRIVSWSSCQTASVSASVA